MVVGTDPVEVEHANVIQVDTDAHDHAQALREIEEWAEGNGFVRTPEYWLRMIQRRDGRRVFRGICYRITAEERETIQEVNEQARRDLERQTATPHVQP